MKLDVTLLAAVGSYLLISAVPARAEGGADEPAVVRLSHGVLRHGSVKNEMKPTGGSTVKEESESFETFPAGLEIATFVKGYAIYAYPQQSGSALWVGKSIGSNLELGGTLSLGKYNTKDADEKVNKSIGAYVWYSAPINPSTNFELNFNPSYIMGNGKTVDSTSGLDSRTETSGYGIYVDALAIFPITKNFEYGAGLDYTMKATETETKTAGATAKVKYNTSDLGIVLAKFRYSI